MSILTRLREKSWETPGNTNPADPHSYRPSAGTVGLFVYFAVAVVMFSLMTATYVMRMGLHSVMNHGGGSDWVSMPDPPLLWINSAILVVSSIAWEAARRAARSGVQDRAMQASTVGAILGLAFLCGQLLLWRQYQASGYYLSANPAYAFFYLLTALHGCHIVGGLVAAGRALGARNFRNIGLCAIYWHFLLLIWVLLAALLVTT
jgi:cytochrome c oxidase subunit 3